VHDTRKRLWNEFYIVVGGPATHWFQAPFWLGVMFLMKASFSLGDVPAT